MLVDETDGRMALRGSSIVGSPLQGSEPLYQLSFCAWKVLGLQDGETHYHVHSSALPSAFTHQSSLLCFNLIAFEHPHILTSSHP